MSVGGEGNTPWESGWESGTPATSPDPLGTDLQPPGGPPHADVPWYVPGPYETFDTTSPRKRRRRRLPVVIAVAAAIGLIAVLLALIAPGGTRTAQAAVIASVNNAVANKTARATLTMNLNSGQMTGTGSGTLDFANGAMDMTMNMNLVQESLSVRLIYLGGKIYEQLPQIAALYPGKAWLSLDLSGLAKSAGGSGALDLGGNPSAMLRLLTQQGATITSTGSTEINGVNVKSYAVTFDPSVIEKQISSANIPTWIRDAISQVNFQNISEDVYIDGSGQLRRAVVHMGIAVPGSQQRSVNVEETLDLSDYGVLVSISAPPANQVVDFGQFLNAFGSHSNG
jgi:hypothetical protein